MASFSYEILIECLETENISNPITLFIPHGCNGQSPDSIPVTGKLAAPLDEAWHTALDLSPVIRAIVKQLSIPPCPNGGQHIAIGAIRYIKDK